jgi:cardiolipin synthase (CMP-forming)
MSLKKFITLPNLLTLFRIAVIPTFVLAFYVNTSLARWSMFVLFVIAGITDYLDGYYARRLGQISDLGKLLDPIADKILITCILVLLIDSDQLKQWAIIPTLIILAREFFVSGLREFLATIQVQVPVTQLAKWKTTFQIIALGTLLFGYAIPDQLWINILGKTLLWVAALLTLVTGYAYLKQGFKHLRH